MTKLTLAVMFVAGCSDDEGGPIDGTWSLTSTTCDGAPGQFPPYELAIANATGTFTLTFAADCVAIFEETYTYSDAAITITADALSCNPSAGCAGIGVDCTALPPPITFDFERNEDTLVFTRISVGPPIDTACPAGQEIELTMTRR